MGGTAQRLCHVTALAATQMNANKPLGSFHSTCSVGDYSETEEAKLRVAPGFPTVLSFNIVYGFVQIMGTSNVSKGSSMTCARGLSTCLVKRTGGIMCIRMETQRRNRPALTVHG